MLAPGWALIQVNFNLYRQKLGTGFFHETQGYTPKVRNLYKVWFGITHILMCIANVISNLEYKVLTNKSLLQSITGIIFIVLPYLVYIIPSPTHWIYHYATSAFFIIRTACLAKY